ncbi:MAG: hypothetical protein IPL84_00730 [Chitinophagaceae bacterium]|nr:hypothetical protein [Chitinophagaceae bacterium]
MKKIPVGIVIMLLFFESNSQVMLKNDLTPQGTVSVQPMKNDFHLRAGESGDIKIYISNKMGAKMQFNVYLGDWRRDTTGSHVYSPPGTEPNSCAAWLTFDKKFIEVDTGAIGIINVKMQVPETPEAVAEMKWAMLFVETIRESKAPAVTKEMRTEIIPATRFGIHIYQTPPAINQKELKLSSFTNVTGKENAFRIVCENTGNVQLNCKSYIEMYSLEDGKKITANPVEVPLFPGQIRYIDFTLPDETKKGKYTLVGVVDPGDEMDIEAAQLIINVH